MKVVKFFNEIGKNVVIKIKNGVMKKEMGFYDRQKRKSLIRKELIKCKKEIIEDFFERLMNTTKMTTYNIRTVLSYLSARDLLKWSADPKKTDKLIELISELNELNKAT
jgi:hypothetical protein